MKLKKEQKIVFFVVGLDAGGLETYLLRFLQLYNDEFQAVIFCKGGKFGQLEDSYRKLSNIKLIKRRISFFNPLDYIFLFRYLKKGGFNVCCDFTGNFAGLVMMVSKLSGIKKRIVFYRSSSDRFQKTFVKNMYNNLVKKLAFKYSTKILSNSKTALNYYYPKIWRNNELFEVIYNGVKEDDYIDNFDPVLVRNELKLPENAFVIGHTGRFNEAKNHKTIIKVAEAICNKYSNIHFIVCGSGTDSAEFSRMVDDSIKSQFHQLGYRSDVPKILSAMDIYLFPSTTEGQPNALIEAMISGLPIIASNIPSIVETVEPSFQKKLFEPLDYESIISVIEYLYWDRNKTYEFLQRDWAVQKFNYKNNFNRFLSTLEV